MGNKTYCSCGSSPRNLSVCWGPAVGHLHCRRIYNNKGKLSTASDLGNQLNMCHVAGCSLGKWIFPLLSADLTVMQIMITVLGLIQFVRGKASTSFKESWFEGSATSPASYSLAFYSGLWAFDGWDQANYVGGEMKHPEKNIPRAIHTSMFVVTVRLSFFRSFTAEPCAVTFHYGERVVLRGTRQGICQNSKPMG